MEWKRSAEWFQLYTELKSFGRQFFKSERAACWTVSHPCGAGTFLLSNSCLLQQFSPGCLLEQFKPWVALSQREEEVFLAGSSSSLLRFLFPTDFLEKIANGDHIMIGCLATGCKCEQIAKHLDHNHDFVCVCDILQWLEVLYRQ